jgi:hypothetical protein
MTRAESDAKNCKARKVARSIAAPCATRSLVVVVGRTSACGYRGSMLGTRAASSAVMRMRARMSIGLVVGVMGVVSACGGSDEPQAGSSSSSEGEGSTNGGGGSSTSGGAGSSETYDCSPPYNSYASVTFEEDNASDRLRGITVEACQAAACAIGTVKQAEAGAAYAVDFTTEPDAVNVGAIVTSGPDGKLRFAITWMVPYNAPSEATAKDGDTFRVRAYFAGDGANTFEHAFAGACAKGRCGTVCKLSSTT